jgi:hypothetical protein
MGQTPLLDPSKLGSDTFDYKMYFNYLTVGVETTPNPNYLDLTGFPNPSILGLIWLSDPSHLGMAPLLDPRSSTLGDPCD